MRVVAISAAHLAFQHWMMVRQTELDFLIGVAGETGFRVLARIDDTAHPAAAAGGNVQAARPVAHLTTLGLDAITEADARMR